MFDVVFVAKRENLHIIAVQCIYHPAGEALTHQSVRPQAHLVWSETIYMGHNAQSQP